MHAWIKSAVGDFTYLRKRRFSCPIIQKDIDAWHKLHDEYLNDFEKKGKDELRKLLEKRLKLQTEYILDSSKNKFNATKISVINNQIADIEKKMNTGITVEQANVYIGKWFGSIISLKTISAREFFTMRNEYIKFVEQQKNQK